jgi:peroxiredoxin Q/BCP
MLFLRLLRFALPSAAALLLVAAVGCSTPSAQGLIRDGTPAPAFSARDQTGAVRTLAEFSGRPLVLFFYPRDGTPGCTKEACAFRDAWKRYEEAGVGVVGISTDDVATHARFAAEHRLPFPLLADEDGAVARAYGVDLTLGLAQRVTVLVGPDGVVRRTWPDVDPGVHAAQVLPAATATGAMTTGATTTP